VTGPRIPDPLGALYQKQLGGAGEGAQNRRDRGVPFHLELDANMPVLRQTRANGAEF
jgi:hypothetical protein